jgi:hypothetical protein
MRSPSHSASHQPDAPEASVLALQRAAGNRAVSRLITTTGGGAMLRQAAVTTTAGEAAAEAPAEPEPRWWPKGPTVDRKSQTVSLSDFVGWVQEVEKAHGDRKEVVKRLRRLYYSSFVKSRVGTRFDQLIAGDTERAPLTTPPVSLDALNGLFGTDTITTPKGDAVDPSHIFTMLDTSLSQPSTLGKGLETVSGTPVKGIVTWTGDLGSWFVDFVDQKAKKEKKPKGKPAVKLTKEDEIALLMSRVNQKVARDDILGDMDAQAIARGYVTQKFVEKETFDKDLHRMQKEVVRAGIELDKPVSEILTAYYGEAEPKASADPREEPIEKRRFPLFVQAAVPSIPNEVPDPARPLEVKLASGAQTAIYKAIRDAAEVLMEGSAIVTRAGTPDALDEGDHVVRHIANLFFTFLETGLKSGDAEWPPSG